MRLRTCVGWGMPFWAAMIGGVLIGCARPAARPHAAPAARHVVLDSTTAATLCVAPDSSRPGGAGCDLRDQSRPPAARPLPP